MSKSRAKSKGRKSKKGSSEEAEHIVEFGRAGFSFNYGCQFPVEEAAKSNFIYLKVKRFYKLYTLVLRSGVHKFVLHEIA